MSGDFGDDPSEDGDHEEDDERNAKPKKNLEDDAQRSDKRWGDDPGNDIEREKDKGFPHESGEPDAKKLGEKKL